MSGEVGSRMGSKHNKGRRIRAQQQSVSQSVRQSARHRTMQRENDPRIVITLVMFFCLMSFQ
eukprot:237886-Hanusia_phi.AAC.7